MLLKRRSLVPLILLSIITCGIYMYYYLYTVTADLNTISGNEDPSPVAAVVLTIVTCGIYSYFWYYKQGNKIQQLCGQRNIPIQENGSTYLVWMIFGALLCGIGALYGIFLFIKNLNILVDDFNAKAFNRS